MTYGGFWRRFAALLIDLLILLIPSLILNWALPVVGSVALGFFYRPFFDSSELKGTPGKVFMGLAVTTEAGERVSFKQAVIRYLLAFVSGLFLGFGYLMNLFTPKRQTFHDMMAGTVVLRRPEMENVDWVGAWTREFKKVFNLQESSFSGSPSSLTGSMEASSSTAAEAPLATLESLHKLHQQGAITDAEYNAKKEELLKKI